MLTGLPPFFGQTMQIVMKRILNGEFCMKNYFSKEVVDLIRRLLCIDVFFKIITLFRWKKDLDRKKEPKKLRVILFIALSNGNDLLANNALLLQSTLLSLVERLKKRSQYWTLNVLRR